MLNILIPTDFSDNSWNAIQYSLQLFKDLKCKFILLHSVTPSSFTWENVQSNAAETDAMFYMEKKSRSQLNLMIQNITTAFNNPKHTFTSKSSFNTITREIDEIFKSTAMDMIVMGTKGASGLQRVLFGSNTIHVIENAKCPVLAIPEDFSFTAPKQILFPTDFEVQFQREQLKVIIDIAELFGAKLNILHVKQQKLLNKDQHLNKKKMEDIFKSLIYSIYEQQAQEIQGAIEAFQMEVPVDILVMVKNKHTFLENLFFKPIINHIGFHLNIPFLVIPVEN